jgi:hypothetical protein
MKFRVTFKDPDGVSDSLQDAVEQSLSGVVGLTEPERNSLMEKRYEDILQITNKWIGYGEYLSIEIDTDTQTATVVENK